jgi:Family of unknown function (DUF6600)/FecR protein
MESTADTYSTGVKIASAPTLHPTARPVRWSNRTVLRACAIAALLLILFLAARPALAQDNQDRDDPPGRVARLGYVEGAVSFQPAGEQDWVQAVPNRPMTTGDKLWADQNSRAELQLGSAVIRLSANTGVTLLNLDDQTVQLELSSGAVNVRVRELDPSTDFEIDTPNLAFTVSQPGVYRLDASEDGSNTAVTIRSGEGDATGNGQTYTIHQGQLATFNGTDSLNADVEQIQGTDQFDTWANERDRRYDNSRSAQYLSRDLVGYEDLDDNGDWRDEPNYGHVWYPSRVEAGWAPYQEGHWDWIDPWGYTWVDDESWGYAPFHYGRWVSVGGRWGWIPGPPAERPVYAPALVVFVGGGGGGNIGWFPLGPREVYVPSYRVSRGYMNRVNVSSTTVNVTTVTNVYNTRVVNRTTNITNVTYANRSVPGAVVAVSQTTFAGAQPVGHARVQVSAQQVASMPMTARVAVNPTRESVLGVRAATANHVSAPPAAVVNRQVIAKKAPPPPPPSFAARQQAMASNPGQPLARTQLSSLRPAAGSATAAARPEVKVAPAGKPATPTTGHPNTSAVANRPGGAPAANQPAPTNRPEPNRPVTNQPAPNNQPEPNRPPASQPAPNNRPEMNRPEQPPTTRSPAEQPGNRPPANQPPVDRPNNRPEANRPPENQPAPNNRPDMNRPAQPPAARPPVEQPNTRPESSRPEVNRPPANQPPAERPDNRPEPNRAPENQTAPNNRPETTRPTQPPAQRPPAEQPTRPQVNQPANRPPAESPNNRPAPNGNRPVERPNNPPPPPAARQPERTPPETKPAPTPKPPAEKQKPDEKKKDKQDKPQGE